jgi:4-hydroxy-tetrahydrodipicolinate synthase
VPVVAGIIANSTREVIARARAVADLGVEAVQVTPPFYVFTPDEPRQPMAYPTAAQQAESAPLLRALLAAYDPAR